MRILIITQIFKPELSLVLPLAKGLKQRGHDVQVLTGFPNYPGGKVYPGYKIRLWQGETIDDLPVLRVALYPSHDNSSFRRAVNYASFAFSSASIGLLLSKTPDVVYAYDSLGNIGLTALSFRLFRGIPFVYNIVDLFPDTMAVSEMFYRKSVFGVMGKWCLFVYKHASRIVVQSPGIKNTLLSRGVPGDKIDLVYNWCPDEDEIRPLDRDETLAHNLGMANRFNVVFAGNIGNAQGLDAVLDAAHMVAGQCPVIQLVIVGNGVKTAHLRSRIIDEKLANVLFLPWCSAKDIAAILALSDIALVHLKDEPLFRITIPSKTQAYMSAGKPILMGVRGDAAEIVQRSKAGNTCVPGDPESIAESIKAFFKMSQMERDLMGKCGRQFYQKELSISRAVQKFENIFNLAIENKGNDSGTACY